MNRTTLNLVLAALVLSLAAGSWLTKRKKDAPKPTLTPLAAEGVNRIAIEWPDSPAIRLEKQGEDWRLTAPVAARVDRFEAVGATSLASTTVQDTVDGEGLDPKELGLEPPDHVVTLNDVKIEFGATEPLQYRRYVRTGGVVQLIEDPASAALDKDYADLVSKELFAAGDELVKIELPGKLVLTRAGDGQWAVPAGTRHATPAALKTLAEGWKGARAMWNEMAPGAAPAGEAVRITLKDGRVVDFVVAATDPQLALYAPVLGIRYQLSRALSDELLKLPEPPPAEAKPALKS